MATLYNLYTSATDEEIISSFDRAFTERPNFFKGLTSFSKKTALQRARYWESVQPTEPEAVREYELAHAGEVERVVTEKYVGSISGSRIALALDPPGSSPRGAIYAPMFKTAWGGLLNQFSSDFKTFSKIVLDNLREVDPGASLEKG